jgi:chromosomal replication initiator protein
VNGVVAIPLSARVLDEDFGPVSDRRHAPSLREFVVGPENRLVPSTVERCLATAAVVDNFDVQASARARWSPLVLCGPPGSGKSHLAGGLAQRWRELRPADPIVTVTSADFVRELNDATERNAIEPWRNSYRTVALLVLEDLARLSTRAAQIEFLQTLDALEDQAQVVVTSRVAVQRIAHLLPSLASRLESGLTVSLNLPEPQTRRELLARLAAARGTRIAGGALDCLADGLAVNVPELFGALLYLETSALLNDEPIEMSDAQAYVAARGAARCPTLRGIAAHTAKHFALRVAELKSASRRRGVVIARDVAMYLARQLTGKSLGQIGAYFGGRDHTTVLHGCRKTESLIQSDPITHQAVLYLRDALGCR